jgi:hypothetical protein
MQGHDAQLRARLVLEDAREAAARLDDRLKAGGNWRIDWVATVALLRVVGHVLDKVDATASADAKAAIAAAWTQWKTDPDDAIFRDFIDPERNIVLKEYELGTYAPAYLLKADGGRLLLADGSGAILLEQPNLDRVYDALQWWETQLTAIETKLAQSNT